MAFYEQRARRNGVAMPVQCILMRQRGTARELRLHYHEYTELLFGISGRARVAVGRGSFPLEPGSMAVIYSSAPHDVLACGEPCSYYVVKFLPQILLAGEQTYSEYGYVLMLMQHLPHRQFLFGSEELAQTEVPVLFRHLMEEWDRQEFGYELSLRADVTRIFLYILRRWRERNLSLVEPLSASRDLMQRVLSYIHAHYSDLTEESTAAACGISPAHLSRSFRQGMGTTFSAYVTGVRLREGERLLLTTDDSVTDIAQNVGFSTAAYFIARFREANGVTPSRYRRACRGDGGSSSGSQPGTG